MRVPTLPQALPGMKRTLKFRKMHGLGNDFVILNGVHQIIQLDRAQVRAIADRNRGVGCDQLLILEPPRTAENHFSCRIYNADGIEVEQCGNGMRCIARFIQDCALSPQQPLRVESRGGIVLLSIEKDNRVSATFKPPNFQLNAIPASVGPEAEKYPVTLPNGHTVQVGLVSLGNPHAILFVEDLDQAPVQEYGFWISQHSCFPKQINVGFASILNLSSIRLRIFERGVGETQACGTGACAAAIVGRRAGLLTERTRVQMPGGELEVYWPGNAAPITTIGHAKFVFKGTFSLPTLMEDVDGSNRNC